MTFQDTETDSGDQLLDQALPAIARLEAYLAEERGQLDAIDLIAPRRWDYEEFHSRIIDWLLDPSAHHGQAESFIGALLDATAAPQKMLDADWSAAQVCRERKLVDEGKVGYLDILVLNQDIHNLIAIENKTRSQEHSNQLTRYRRALERDYPDPYFARHHIFLSSEGFPPNEECDRRYWQPASYSAIHDAIRGVLETGDVADPEAKALLQIYATTIRRNFMPDTSLDRQARRIYIKQWEAIERIVANKPNWIDETKLMLRKAVAKHPCWKLDHEDDLIVRFRAADWDEFPSSRTGTGWLPESPALLVFQLRFDNHKEPHFRSTPYFDKKPYLDLGLSKGTSKNAEIRSILFDAVRQNPDVFKPTSYVLTDDWMHLHEESDYILEPDDYGLGWDDGTARRKIGAWIDKFAVEQFHEMNRIIVDCLRRHQETRSA